MIGFNRIDCGGCGISYFVPTFWLDDRRKTGDAWKCPNGCHRAFNETEADKLRQERDKLKQRQAYLRDRIDDERKWRETAERSAAAYKGQATKLRNRAKNGVCPCCNRTFQNLARHMNSKHPGFQSEQPTLSVIAGGKP